MLPRSIAPFSPYVNRRFGGKFHLHLQGRKTAKQESNVQQVYRRWYVPLKHGFTYGPHGSISRTMATFIIPMWEPQILHIFVYSVIWYTFTIQWSRECVWEWEVCLVTRLPILPCPSNVSLNLGFASRSFANAVRWNLMQLITLLVYFLFI
jgi:hypothetical protein